VGNTIFLNSSFVIHYSIDLLRKD